MKLVDIADFINNWYNHLCGVPFRNEWVEHFKFGEDFKMLIPSQALEIKKV